MTLTGQLLIEAEWNGRSVPVARAQNSRPPAARLLVGRPVDEALARVPALFALCGRAQTLTARAAVAAARGEAAPDEAARTAAERAIAAEAAQEHLWRLLLDWPALFGIEPRRGRFAELHRQLARVAGNDADGAREVGGQILDLVAAELLAGFFTVAREPSSLAEFASRARRGGSVGAALGDLLEMGSYAPPRGMAPCCPVSAPPTGRQCLPACRTQTSAAPPPGKACRPKPGHWPAIRIRCWCASWSNAATRWPPACLPPWWICPIGPAACATRWPRTCRRCWRPRPWAKVPAWRAAKPPVGC